MEDLAELDDRAAAIGADHPECVQALRNGRDEVVVDGQPISVRLHFAIHEIVANQLADDDPAEVFQAARRLLDAGNNRHELLHTLAAPLAEQISPRPRPGKGYDRERRIEALPGAIATKLRTYRDRLALYAVSGSTTTPSASRSSHDSARF